MAKKKREEKPVRVRAARKDASVKSIEKRVEKDYKLPSGSVQINRPGKKDARGDKKVGKLRKEHDKK